MTSVSPLAMCIFHRYAAQIAEIQPSSSNTITTETLYEIIGALAEGPTLDRVLRAVVDVLVHATACHACFIYVRDEDVLRLRAASPIYGHAVGSVAIPIDEGLTGWVARNRAPAFIREAAMTDPRMKYVPELQEEDFQSMVAVPLLERRGDVIGVVVLHTEAPREFGQDVLDLLVHVASLVAGAIDNARVYEQVADQVTALAALNSLSQRLASAAGRDDLYAIGCEGLVDLLHSDRCELVLFDAQGAGVEVASHPGSPTTSQALPSVPAGQLSARLWESDQAFGLVRVTRTASYSSDDGRLLQTAANQLALALRKAEIIERLAAENRVRSIFDALRDDRAEDAMTHARAVGWASERPYTVIVALPSEAGGPWSEERAGAVEQRLRLACGNALIDLQRDGGRVLAPLPPGTGSARERLDELRDRLQAPARELGVAVGLGLPRASLADGRAALEEATDAARIVTSLISDGGARSYAELGPYRFLVGLIGTEPPAQEDVTLLNTLAEHDRRRGTRLLDTLEAFLETRGAVGPTARSLYIHPNTLRQRLERIQSVAHIDLRELDLLSLELSLKLYRLRRGSPLR